MNCVKKWNEHGEQYHRLELLRADFHVNATVVGVDADSLRFFHAVSSRAIETERNYVKLN